MPSSPKHALPSQDHIRAGWSWRGPGLWRRGAEVILRRDHGIWFWYPDGLSGGRGIGPFKTMKAARHRAFTAAPEPF